MAHGKWLRTSVASLMILDLVLKYFAISPPVGEAGGNYAVINQGVSFGVLMGSEWVYYILISILLIWLIREKMWWIAAGGAANVISRVVWGGVVDYWNFLGLFSNNLADWMIVGGVVEYFYKAFRRKF